MTGASYLLVPAALSAESWEIVFKQTSSFAKCQVTRLRWRHEFGGLLPSGFDPNSIAAQAIMEFLLDHSLNPAPNLNLSSQDAPPSVDDILWQVKRLVLKQVTRLHHRKENWLLSNSEDLAPVEIDDGDLVSLIEFIPDPGPHPATSLLEKESLAQFDSSRSRFSSFINREPRLGSLFKLLCEGLDTPQALASSLKVRRGTVQNLRKRLRRRWRRCFAAERMRP